MSNTRRSITLLGRFRAPVACATLLAAALGVGAAAVGAQEQIYDPTKIPSLEGTWDGTPRARPVNSETVPWGKDNFPVLNERAKAYQKKFFLILNHEPEDDVRPRAGSGMTAKDFSASFRHVIQRLRAKGVTNVVSVVAYMGNEKWMAQSWWKDLYPGDDVVDWIGLDSYVSAEQNYYHHGLFADLVDRRAPGGDGFYDWATRNHKGKPMMLAEWGVYHRVGRVVDKSAQFDSVLPTLAQRPAIKAIVYFDTKKDAFGDRDISINSSARSLASFKKLAANPVFNVQLH